MTPQTQAAQTQPPQGAPPGKPQGQPVDPKKMEQYHRLAIGAMKIIYDKAVAPGLVQMMQSQDDPAQGMAMACMAVVEKMKESVKGIEPNLVYGIAPVVLGFLAELGEVAGLFKSDSNLIKEAITILQQQLMADGQGQPQAPAAAEPPAAQTGGLIASEMGGMQ